MAPCDGSDNEEGCNILMKITFALHCHIHVIDLCDANVILYQLDLQILVLMSSAGSKAAMCNFDRLSARSNSQWKRAVLMISLHILWLARKKRQGQGAPCFVDYRGIVPRRHSAITKQVTIRCLVRATCPCANVRTASNHSRTAIES